MTIRARRRGLALTVPVAYDWTQVRAVARDAVAESAAISPESFDIDLEYPDDGITD